MLLDDAVRIMGFNSLNEVDRKKLLSRRRELAKKNHPDMYYSDVIKAKKHEEIMKQINEAYSILNSFVNQIEKMQKLAQLSKQNEIFAVIPLDSLVEMYSGQTIELKEGDSKFILTKSNIRAHRVFLLIECIVHYFSGEMLNGCRFSTFKKYDISDTYEIDCDIPVYDNESVEATVKIYNKTVKVVLKSTLTRLRVQFKNRVYVIINIKKKINYQSWGV